MKKEWKGNSEEEKKRERERSSFSSSFYETGAVLNISHEVPRITQGRESMIK